MRTHIIFHFHITSKRLLVVGNILSMWGPPPLPSLDSFLFSMALWHGIRMPKNTVPTPYVQVWPPVSVTPRK